MNTISNSHADAPSRTPIPVPRNGVKDIAIRLGINRNTVLRRFQRGNPDVLVAVADYLHLCYMNELQALKDRYAALFAQVPNADLPMDEVPL